MIPWKSTEKDGPPQRNQRVIAVQANPIIGTEIVTLYGHDFDHEFWITHWCATQDIEVPEGVTPVRREP